MAQMKDAGAAAGTGAGAGSLLAMDGPPMHEHGGWKVKPSMQAMAQMNGGVGFLTHWHGGWRVWPSGHSRAQMAMGGFLTQEQGGLNV